MSSLVETVLKGVDDLDAIGEGAELNTTTARIWKGVGLVHRHCDINVNLRLHVCERLGNDSLLSKEGEQTDRKAKADEQTY